MVNADVPNVVAVVAAHSPLTRLLVRSHWGMKSPKPGVPGPPVPLSVHVRVAVVAMRAIGLEIE